MFMKNPEIQPMLDAIGWTTTAVEKKSDQSVRQFKLLQNYPNPFNSQTEIRFSLARSVPVTLEIYNLLGEKVVTFFNKEYLITGVHQANFNAEHLPSGIYFYRIEAGDFKEMKKMMLVR